MASNAPYYQVRRQFNGTNAHFATDDDYELPTSVTPNNASPYADVPNPDGPANTLEENHHLAELLEAATTAASQAAETLNMDRGAPQNGGKRKRTSGSPASEGSHDEISHGQSNGPSAPKRARIDIPTDPHLHDLNSNRDTPFDSSMHPTSDTLLSDARAAGVHSAAALFRRSSKETSRKYTRPPMSKLFMSLQLTPENFLHLQARAKIYMLDTAHPDRQSCVGNRGKGDTDMVKLRLFNCVRDFLNDGAGEQFFGEHVEKPGERDAIDAARALGEEKAPVEGKLVWPRDGNKIISLVTPLLRRMVTNERQRMYAIETRKGGAKRKEGSVEAQAPDHNMSSNHYQHHDQEPTHGALETKNTPSPHVYTPHQQSHPISPVSVVPPPNSALLQHPSAPPQEAPYVCEAIRHLNSTILHLDTNELPLPESNDAEANLHTINIYLTKCSIKLRPIKRVQNDSKVLFEYTLAELKQEIHLLIQLALSTYPALRPPQSMGPEALRGLAVAATEMQDRSPSAEPALNTVPVGNITPSSPVNLASSTMITETIPYTVQAMRSSGLTYIKNDGKWDQETWMQVKRDVGFSVWAAGAMTVVVDLL